MPHPMRPQTARRRSNIRLAACVLVCAMLGALGVLISYYVDVAGLVILVAVEMVLFGIMWAIQLRGDLRDRARVDVYIARSLGSPADDPEIDPQTDV